MSRPADSRELVAAPETARVMDGLLDEVDFAGLDGGHLADLAALCQRRLEGGLTPSVRRQLGGEAEVRRLGRTIAEDALLLKDFYALLQDDSVSDVLVNGPEQVWVERNGRLEATLVRFSTEEALLRVARWMTARVGRTVHEGRPIVDARLPDGSRINVVIPPVALDGVTLSIRRFRHAGLDLSGLVRSGTVPQGWDTLLRAVVAGRLNVLVAGGTGSGKTTMLNALSEAISGHERVVTVEDAAELRLRQAHVVRLETRPAGSSPATARDLVRNALRMRPDRILVGEVRGPEAVDMLQAMNTGHEGSMSTVHANSPRDALDRLEVMIGMAGLDLPDRLVRRQISRSLDVVVHLRRLADGRRVVSSIAEVGPVQGDVIGLQELLHFRLVGHGADGRVAGSFVATGVRPSFLARLEHVGIPVPAGLWRGQGA